MKSLRTPLALALACAFGPACAADLATLYRDARVTDPVYQSARSQYNATIEKLPQARYDQAVAKEISDKTDLEVKRRALQVLLGKVPDGLTPLKEPLELALPKPNDIEAWVKAASESSYTITVARANFEIARREIDRQFAGHYPTVDLSASIGRAVAPQSAVPGIIGATSDATSVGLTLSVPLFSGGITQSRVREAVATR